MDDNVSEKNICDIVDDEDIPSDFFDDFTKDEFIAGLDAISPDKELEGFTLKEDITDTIKDLRETNKDLRRKIIELKKKTIRDRETKEETYERSYLHERYKPHRARLNVREGGPYFSDRSPRRGYSPKWKGHSPFRKRNGSPFGRDRSPRRGEGFKRRREASPWRREESLRRRENISRHEEASPRRRRFSPRRHSRSPYRWHPRHGSESLRRRSKSAEEHQNRSPHRVTPMSSLSGVRRDVEKTNRAIRQDKEMKVKQYLNKHLETAEDDVIAPPGTELEGFFNEIKRNKKSMGSPGQVHEPSPAVQRIVPHLPMLSKDYDLRNVMSRSVEVTPTEVFHPTPVPPTQSFIPQNTPYFQMEHQPVYQGVIQSDGFYGQQNVPPTMYMTSSQYVPPPKPVPAPEVLDRDESKWTGLDKLYAEGKISKEDYLKLTPKPPVSLAANNLTDKVKTLSICTDIIKKLTNLHLPNLLIIDTTQEDNKKAILPKYCSPLKKVKPVTYSFTSSERKTIEAQNQALLQTIINALGLEKAVLKEKSKKQPKFKEIGVQTSADFCDVCFVKSKIGRCSVSTQVEVDHFTQSIHTQVIESELATTKTVFMSGGSSRPNDNISTMSLSHMTPAQLVSQLAAKAKNLQGSNTESDYSNQRRQDYYYHQNQRPYNQYSQYYNNQGGTYKY